MIYTHFWIARIIKVMMNVGIRLFMDIKTEREQMPPRGVKYIVKLKDVRGGIDDDGRI
jgi:hypothetical protein